MKTTNYHSWANRYEMPNAKNIGMIVGIGMIMVMFAVGISMAQPTYSNDDFFSELLSVESGPARGEAIFRIANPTGTDGLITKDMFGSRFIKGEGATEITSTTYYIKEVTSNVFVRDDISCRFQRNGTYVGNGSDRYDNFCSSIPIFEDVVAWTPLTEKSLFFEKDRTFDIKVVVTWNPRAGINRRDWIPQLNYAGRLYEKPEWAWFDSNWSFRVNITVDASRLWDLIEVNESSANITRGTEGGIDIRVLECGSAREVEYQPLTYNSTGGGHWWNSQNVSSWQAKGTDNWTIFRITNTSETCYSFYFNNTGATDNSTEILVREDDFESYSTGSHAQGFNTATLSSCGGVTPVVQAMAGGGQGYGDFTNLACAEYIHTSDFTDGTFILESNNTREFTVQNSYYATAPNSFSTNWNPRISNDLSNTELFRSGVSQDTGADLVINGYYNATLVINGTNTVRWFIDDASTPRLEDSDSAAITDDTIIWHWGGNPADGRVTYATEWRFYVLPLLPYADANLTFGPVETEAGPAPPANNVPVVTISFPENQSYNLQNGTFNFTPTDDNNTILTCWSIFDGSETPLGETINGTNNGTASGNFDVGAHILNITCQETTGELLNGSSVVEFSSYNDVPNVIVGFPLNATFNADNLTADFTPFDNLSLVLPTCWSILDNVETNRGPVTNATNTTFNTGNLAEGSHNLTIKCEDSWAFDPGALNGTTTVEFSIFNDIPAVTITVPANITYQVNNLTFNFTVTDNLTDPLTCWKIQDSVETNLGPISSGVPYLNFSGQLDTGAHILNITCQDASVTPKNGSTVVEYSVFRGLNLSAFLPNATTAIANWQFTASNSSTTGATFTSLNNPVIVTFGDLNVTGEITLNATAGGHDSELFSFNESDSTFPQHNFTLYPLSHFYLLDTDVPETLNSWTLRVNNGTDYLTQVATNSQNIVSNRLFSVGNNTFIAELTGFQITNITLFVNASVAINYTFSTNSTGLIIEAFDEVIPTRELSFNADFRSIGTNVTVISMTGARYGPACLYDGDETTTCLESSTGLTINTSTVQAFDYSEATFRMAWKLVVTDCTTGSPPPTFTCTGTVTVRVGDDIWFQESSSTTAINIAVEIHKNSTFTIDNSAANYSRAANMTILVTTTRSGGSSDPRTTIMELRQVNNSIGYIYPFNVNHTISYPVSLVQNFTTYDVFLRGETTFETSYTARRMYRVAISQLSTNRLSAYLLRDILGFTQNFRVLDVNNQPIQDALITIQYWYTGVATTVAQCVTNPAGDCGIFLSDGRTYAFTASHPSYDTNSNQATIFDGTADPAIVYLTLGTTTNFTSVFNGITISLEPTTRYVLESSVNATCNVVSTFGNINYINWTGYQFNSTFGNFSLFSNQTSISPSGAILQFEVNESGRYRYECSLQWVSNATGTTTTYTASYTTEFFLESDDLFDILDGVIDQTTGTLLVLGIAVLIGFWTRRFPDWFPMIVVTLLFVAAGWTEFMNPAIATISVVISWAAYIYRMQRRGEV